MKVEFTNYIKDCPENCIEKDLDVELIEQTPGATFVTVDCAHSHVCVILAKAGEADELIDG